MVKPRRKKGEIWPFPNGRMFFYLVLVADSILLGGGMLTGFIVSALAGFPPWGSLPHALTVVAFSAIAFILMPLDLTLTLSMKNWILGSSLLIRGFVTGTAFMAFAIVLAENDLDSPEMLVSAVAAAIVNSVTGFVSAAYLIVRQSKAEKGP